MGLACLMSQVSWNNKAWLFKTTSYDFTSFIQNEPRFKSYIKLQQIRSGIEPEFS